MSYSTLSKESQAELLCKCFWASANSYVTETNSPNNAFYLTFFWNAFFLSVEDILEENNLIDAVQHQYILSASALFDIPLYDVETLAPLKKYQRTSLEMLNNLRVNLKSIQGVEQVLKAAAVMKSSDEDNPDEVCVDPHEMTTYMMEMLRVTQYTTSLLSKSISPSSQPTKEQQHPYPQAVTKPVNNATVAPSRPPSTNLIPIFALLFFVVIIVTLICVAVDGADTTYSPREETESTTEEVFDQPKKTRPKTGHIFHHPKGEKLAPLEIMTDTNDTDGGYYFILQPITGSDKNKIVFFVRAGDTFELDVPLGNYYLYYAYGEYWYGEDYLFGPDTIYQKCDDEFRFYENLSGYNGYTLTLYPVINGNLDTDVIPEDEFPK